MKNREHRPPGFTLVEIMIVVAIIGLLASIAVPNYQRARRETQKNACIANLRQIDGAIQSWAMEQKKSPDQAVAGADISGYLRGRLSCPSGGGSFDESYQLTIVDAPPLCRREPGTHVMP